MKYKFMKIIKQYSLLFFAFIFALFPLLTVPAFADDTDYMFVYDENYIFDNDVNGIEYTGAFANDIVFLKAGTYKIDGMLTSPVVVNNLNCYPLYYVTAIIDGVPVFNHVYYTDGTYTLEITEDMLYDDGNGNYGYPVFVNSIGAPVRITEVQTGGYYYSAFDMFAEFMYGTGELTAEQNMVLTILATTAVLFVVIVPFLLVWWIIRLFTGG